jgi:integrase
VHLLTQLGQRDYEGYRALRQQKLAAKTLYTRLTIVKTFVKWCLTNRGYLDRNPFAGCKLSKPYVAPKFTPTPKQVELLLKNAKGQLQIKLAMLAYAGLRVGELQMLGTRGVDLAGRWIQILAREGWVPKTRQARRIPIHPKLLPYLRRMPRGERAYFFCAAPSPKYPAGGHHINVKHLNEDLQKLAKPLGIPVGRKDNGLVAHSLRHFFETQCVNSGVPQFVTDIWMGHAGQALMAKTYYGLTEGKSKEYIAKVRF